MKIIFLLQSFPCLSETFILNQVTGLIDLGCDVRIVALGKPDDPKQHPAVARYRLFDKTTYIRLPTSKWDTRLKAAAQTLSGFLRHPVLVYRLQKTLLAEGRLYSYHKLFMALAVIRQRADILFCHFGTMGNTAVILKRIGLSAPLVTMFHGCDIRLGIEKGGEIYRELFDVGECFLAISDYNKKHLLDFGVHPRKLIFHPVGINVDEFPLTKNKVDGPVQILTIARLVPEKGLEYAIEAIRKLLDRNADFQIQYNIIGDGPLKENLKEKVSTLRLDNIVHFLGAKTQSEIKKYLATSNVFLLSSVAEALPVCLMEAQATGLPVVASNVGSINQIVKDGETGFLVPPQNPLLLCEKLEYMIINQELWSNFGNSGRQHIKMNFENRKLMKQLLKIFITLTNPSFSNEHKKWKASIKHELKFWDDYFRTQGLQWKDTYGLRLDPDLPLQAEVVELLPERKEMVKILDVGAGPLTYLGKKLEGKELLITAVDPLAKQYNRILKKYNIQPVVRTERLDAEELTKRFSPETFDLVFARNCIDHSYNPEKAILEMLAIVKTGCYVLMVHRQNEAENEGYRGLHQWNFSMTQTGDFNISSKNNTVNFSEKYKNTCKIICTFDSVSEWLTTEILKI